MEEMLLIVSIVLNAILQMTIHVYDFSIAAPTVPDIAKNFRAGNYVDAVQVAIDITPYKFTALISAIGGCRIQCSRGQQEWDIYRDLHQNYCSMATHDVGLV
jgi:hypothetical protein